MKKNYVSLLTACLFALGLNSAFAQSTTITSANLPTIGTTYNQVNDSTPAELPSFTVSAGSASAQTWNYTSEWVTIYASTSSFVTPSSLSGASNFPTANLGETNGGNSVFFTSGASGLSIIGVYGNLGGTFAAIPYTPSEVIIPTPFTYGNTTTNNFISSFSVATTYSGTPIAVQVKQHSFRTITADAFGSLTTPAGTYPSTLRIKTYQLNIDTDFIYLGSSVSGTPFQTRTSRDSSIVYEWLQNASPALLMEIDMSGDGSTVTGANYTGTSPVGIVSVPNSFAELSLYPNPTNTATKFSYQNKYASHVTIQLFDISGRMIGTLADENQNAGLQTLPIDTKTLGLTSGLYFVRISGMNGSETLKLSIN